MIRIKSTGESFETRLEAKIALGSAYFNKLIKDGDVEFIHPTITNYGDTDIIL